jgi:hypothetical protein
MSKRIGKDCFRLVSMSICLRILKRRNCISRTSRCRKFGDYQETRLPVHYVPHKAGLAFLDGSRREASQTIRQRAIPY